jgi:acyl-CoA synthetase (AMP-forming)/AMP-acid ligase II
MPTPVLERALELLPDTGFVNAYGLTETSSTVCVLGPDDHRSAVASDEPAVRARLGSAGQPVPGIEVQIVSIDGAVVTDESVGEIHLRGAQVSGQYMEIGSTRDGDDWLATGDFGWLDVEGYLHVEGRGDDTIIRGGENIGTAEVEDALLQHPAVENVAVVGILDEEWGEQIGAMVSLRAGVTVDEAELQEHVREHLGSFKTPHTIAIRDDLPQTATGKILRRTVRTELGGG